MLKSKKKKGVMGRPDSSKYTKKPYVRQWPETKVAYLTVGRWQPPHRGHEVLIKKTNGKFPFSPLAFGIAFVLPFHIPLEFFLAGCDSTFIYCCC